MDRIMMVSAPDANASAATASDRAVGDAVVRHLTRRPSQSDALSQALADQAIAVANPLRDFLEEVDLVH